MPENYPSANEHIRNLEQLTSPYEVLATEGKFRIVRLAPPYAGGYEIWVVNEKGFLWEPAASIDKAIDYLVSPEAVEYQAAP